MLAPPGVVAAWTADTVSDTDRYVRTVAPLASHPDIQDAVATGPLGIALRIARALYLDALPAGASQPTAAAVYDALTRFPSTTVRMVVVVGVVVALLFALGGVEFLAVGEGPGDEDPGLTRTA
ncbi:hypothetical protein [Streptomyces hokutonensis]|uniref:hypothetical protein n=1 Tax=Streptomyces hokutonensis TaxID=1306990 RepID=UPI003816E0BC